MRNILIIGGSYFLGKFFLEMLCREAMEGEGTDEVTFREEMCVYVLNRGTRPLVDHAGRVPASKKMLQVKHLTLDRHDTVGLERIAAQNFAGRRLDAVVDFCGYSQGDIATVFEHVKTRIAQYIFVSTVDVYQRGTGKLLDEEAPFEERDFGGESGAYIVGKVALERELRFCCERYGTAWTVLRPSVIYGPDNYAPREGMYFHWIREAGQIIHPVDATGSFQPVYVEDVARAIRLCLCNERTYDKAYNVCGGEPLTYEAFAEVLAVATGVDFGRADLSVREILERGIPLPFPLYQEETERYLAERAKEELGLEYTDVIYGMRRAYEEFCKL